MSGRRSWRRTRRIALLLVLAGAVGGSVWYEFFREQPAPSFKSADARFKYGSIGAERDAGIPYWIFVVLPRMFPEYLPGPGGYRAFGVLWEEGEELPIGFTKTVVGFPRVANNCAVCHTASYRTREEETPTYVPGGPNHTVDVQALWRFFAKCAADERFDADDLLAEIARVERLSWFDRLAYRYLIIPRAKQELLERRDQLAWIDRPGRPHWGPGRDDAMNRTKYVMANLPADDTVGPADFPAVWNLKVRDGKALEWDGSAPLTLAVITDSALALGAAPTRGFKKEMTWLEDYLRTLPPPKYPFPMDADLAAAGKEVFDQTCASCHAQGPASRLLSLIDIAEIGTDRNRLDTWTQASANAVNHLRTELGVNSADLTKTNGYIAVPLDGIWLRAPYLHNGSVPNLRDLLEPRERRTKVFYRGYDVYDPRNLGFDSQSEEARRTGFRFDTAERGNGNQGHLYGTDLAPRQKEALLEYLKTL
jgi:hypothetical protein